MIDSSLWIATYRDSTGVVAQKVQAEIAGQEHAFCQFTRIELLQGCRDEREWNRTKEFLDDQIYRELSMTGWTQAGRLYFDLRRQGQTVRSTFDCCIAVIAMEHDLTLLHNDGDYEKIALARPLRQRRVPLDGPPVA